MNPYFTAVYAFICSLFAGQEAQKAPEPIIDPQAQQLFSTILHDNRAKFDAIVHQADKKIILPDGTTPLSFAIQHRKFYFCPELIKEEFLAQPQDLDTARLMQNLQKNEIDGQDACICVNFLEQYLQELKLIPKISDIKRGKDDVPDDLKHFSILMKTKEYALIQATMNNDVIKMVDLITRSQVNPDICIHNQTPIGIAIRESHIEALECLIFYKAKLDLEDEQKAQLYLEILQTNTNQKDMVYPESADQAESHRQHIEKAKLISKIIAKELSAQMNGLTQDQMEPKVYIPRLSARPSETKPPKQPTGRYLFGIKPKKNNSSQP